MARRLTTDEEIDNFIAQVIEQARHHAPEVLDVIQPLSVAVRARIDLNRDRIEIYERNGELARTCWVTIAGRRRVFSYNYGEGVIDLRERSTQGETLFQFDNGTTPAQIQQQATAL